MSESAQALAARLEKRFGETLVETRVHVGQVTVKVAAEHLRSVCLALRDEEEFAFRQLIDVCGVDYLDYGRADWETSEKATSEGFSRGVERREDRQETIDTGRYVVVYHLLSHENNQRLRVKSEAPGDPPCVDSVVDIWSSADWFERETFDLFGILFDAHPDLRRILTDYGFIGHPFRKDFPLIGEVEVRYDPEKRRVVYEPVSIAPRTLVPKVIRHDERYAGEESNDA
ncbi:MAG: NADH-quinone oxidoreductase subunit C [Gammaproteobacteria bacterium]|nr:NADH-quinone oxidoreductase subunit C [Gammaproteobacteria bacterium]NIM73917.1 NADH-quinone oxidoreductase subunit C [Gammaproteobacteria bacterium]NIN38105.1 NADH-quinone oxidoreductase subunit C [Gammaproteobacteria bacterium]NIO25698.1 NADH-quinone oxidoreductase subunit C [Gammaproteobacteria bacterium]NIO66332.1 NADH-quinone oxidoreductase subunit C [Gammaproteobacteria bacterium]